MTGDTITPAQYFKQLEYAIFVSGLKVFTRKILMEKRENLQDYLITKGHRGREDEWSSDR